MKTKTTVISILVLLLFAGVGIVVFVATRDHTRLEGANAVSTSGVRTPGFALRPCRASPPCCPTHRPVRAGDRRGVDAPAA